MTTRDRRFAVITARKIDDEASRLLAVGHFKTCGHDDPNCRSIKPDSLRLALTDEGTLAAYEAAAEWFDGEAQYDAPIVCRDCREHEDPCVCGAYNLCWGQRVRTARSVRDLHRAYND